MLILAEGRTRTVLRPHLVGALVGKAAARTEIASDRASARHCTDFVVLANLVSARDFQTVGVLWAGEHMKRSELVRPP